MKIIGTLFRLLYPYRYWMLLAASLSFLTIGGSIGLLMTSAYIISKAALQPSLAELQIGIVGVRFFGITRGIFRYLERLASHDLTFKLLETIREWFFRAAAALPECRIIWLRRSDLLQRMVTDVENLEHIFTRIIMPPMVAVMTAILMWGVLGIFDPVFPLVLFGFHCAAGLVAPLTLLRVNRTIEREIIQIRAKMNDLMIDFIQGMGDLIMFNADQAHFKELERLNTRYIALRSRRASIDGLQEVGTGLIMNMAVLTLIILAIPMINSSALDGVYLAVIVLGVMASFEAILPMPGVFQALQTTRSAVYRVFEYINDPPDIDTQDKKSQITGHSITFENVSFSYNPNEHHTLKDISFTIPEGTRTAVVGPSGSGKTTLFNLVLKLWQNYDGRILIGNHDIRALDSETVLASFGVASHRSHLFSDTFRANLMLGAENATEDDLMNALDAVQLRDVVSRLPKGLDSWIGEFGAALSRGEQQRIDIARILLKNVPIFLLDEITENMDVLTEKQILETVLKQSNTVLYITHRLIGLEEFDAIHVMLHGQIIENGTFSDLMQQDGYFKRMFDLQRCRSNTNRT